MLASLVNVTHLVEVSGYPLLFLIVMAESSGVPIPGETALIAAAVLASQGKLKIELVIPLAAAAAIVGDNIGYLIGRQRRTLAARTPRPLSAPAPGGPGDGRVVLRAPRPQGRVLRPLHPRPARVGLVAGRRHAHALALVLPLERPRRDLLGDARSDCSPTSSATPPAKRSRRSASTGSSRSCSPSSAGSSCTAAAWQALGADIQQPFPHGAMRSHISASAPSSPSEKREKKCSRTTARCVPRASANRSRPRSVRQA